MISVIIPSYNSENTIAAVLTALKNQTYQGDYEIILVDSSEDQTPQLVKEKFPDVLYHHFDVKTDPGTARNLGVQMSSGDPILFIDSDCSAQPDWIENMVAAHAATDYDAIGGAVENGNRPDCHVAWAGYIAEFREFLPGHKAHLVDHIPTCNISYKRRVFEANTFNSNYYPQEDLEFNYRLRQKGGQILFQPNIRIYHQHREQLKVFFSHQRRIGQITSRMLKILPLQGAKIARSKFLTILFAPLLPIVKLFKTISIFYKMEPKFVFTHWRGFVIFTLGLLPWITGFIAGSFGNTKKAAL